MLSSFLKSSLIGCFDLLLNGRKAIANMNLHVYCKTLTFKAYLLITNLEVMFKYKYVFKILRQTIVEQSEVEISTK